jgi:hypothetical protein
MEPHAQLEKKALVGSQQTPDFTPTDDDHFVLTYLRALRSNIQAARKNRDLLLYNMPRKSEHFSRSRTSNE